MKRQQVQVAGLEPSTVGNKATYAIQIRGVDAEGNYGAWSKAFVFESGTDLPFDLEEGVEDIQAGDLLFYDGANWIGFAASRFARTDEPTFFSSAPTSPDPESPQQLANKNYVDENVSDLIDYVDNKNVTSVGSNTIALNFSTRDELLTRSASGTITFTGSGYTPGVSKTVRIIAGASNRALNFPSGWVFMGDIPSQLPAGKTGILTATSFASSASNVVAAWAEQS